MTFSQDLALVEAIFNDITGFASGKPVVLTEQKIPTLGVAISGSAQILPNGADAQFPVISGYMGFISLGFAAASGLPVSLAEKIGNTWVGYTLTIAKT